MTHHETHDLSQGIDGPNEQQVIEAALRARRGPGWDEHGDNWLASGEFNLNVFVPEDDRSLVCVNAYRTGVGRVGHGVYSWAFEFAREHKDLAAAFIDGSPGESERPRQGTSP